MRTLFFTWIGLASIVSTAGAAPAPRAYHFEGSVREGERFERSFSDSLRFVLRPDDEGWSIVVCANDSFANYAGIATPPFHGPNPTQIEAWHFRNQDNTGPSQGPWPGEERGFSFVLDPHDYQVAASALDVMLWPNDRSEATVDSAQVVYDGLRTGSGRLRITDLRLRELGAGRTPRFESIRFSVWLRLPPGR